MSFIELLFVKNSQCMRPLQILLCKWLFFLRFHICEMLDKRLLLKLFQYFSSSFVCFEDGLTLGSPSNCVFLLWETSFTSITLLLVHLIANYFLEVVVLSNMPEVQDAVSVWQIFRALSYIHRTIGVCHRDIKPQNLLVYLSIPLTLLLISL